MTYSYTELKNAYRSGRSLDTYEGKNILAVPKKVVSNAMADFPEEWFIVCDDNNAFVRDGFKYGYVSKDGAVYKDKCISSYGEVVEVKVEEKELPATEYSAMVEGFFSKLDFEIMKFLEDARNWRPEI